MKQVKWSEARPNPANAAPPGEVRDPAPGGGLLIGRFAGVPIYVAPTWFIVAALITWGFAGSVERAVPGLGPWRYAVSLAFALLLYGSVLIHELSHTVVALRAGLPVRRISLHLLGGVSEIDRAAPAPGVEARIAAAGPALSLLLAATGLVVASLLDHDTVGGLLARALVWSNLVVGVFNLLPGLPLDGGRVLAAAVWKTTGRQHTGTVAAAWAGRVVAVVTFLLPSALSVFFGGQPDLIDVVWGGLLGSFIWLGASQALQFARLQQRLPAMAARRFTRPAITVAGDVPLSEALRRAAEERAGAIVVADAQGAAVGIVHEASVMATPEARRPWIPVADVARRIDRAAVVPVDLAGEDLVRRLTHDGGGEHLVVNPDGSIAGVLSTRDVERALGSS